MAFLAGEAGGEVGWGRGTPGEDADVGGEEAVEDLRVDELVGCVVEWGGVSGGCGCGCGFGEWTVTAYSDANDLAECRDAFIGAAALGVVDCVVAGPAEYGFFLAGEAVVGD